jgi:hypothetical protein
VKSKRIRALVVATMGAAILAHAAVGGAYAQGLTQDQWNSLVAQQPLLSQVLATHETSAVADFLGISAEQLKQEAIGHTLAEVASNHGKSAESLTAVMKDTAYKDLDTALFFGFVAKDRAADYRAQIDALMPDLVATSVTGLWAA